MTARTSGDLYPQLPQAEPSAPPCDEGFGGSSGLSSSWTESRGVLRPHSASPFLRNVKPRVEQPEDGEVVYIEAIAGLLNFSSRGLSTPPPAITTIGSFGSPDPVMVRTFVTSTPKTPATAPRPDCPPRISSRRVLPGEAPRPRALRRPPSAALGAPPQRDGQDEEDENIDLPDIPDTPQSPPTSDITIRRSVFFSYFC